MISAFVISVGASAATRKLGIDFGALDQGAEAGLKIGWYLKDGLIDQRPIDYERLATDDAYVEKLRAQHTANESAFEDRIVNLIYREGDGVAITEVPKNNKNLASACFNAKTFVLVHRYCSLFVDQPSGFIVYQQWNRWGDAGNIVAIRYDFKTQQATAWGNLTEKAEELFAESFRLRFAGNSQYEADKSALLYAPWVKGFSATGAPNSVIAKGVVNALVPKGDDTRFDEVIKGNVKLVDDGDSAIRFEAIPSPSPRPTSEK